MRNISLSKIVSLTIIILSIFTIPALAISKGDLMTSYRTTPGLPVGPENKTDITEEMDYDPPAWLPVRPFDGLPYWNWFDSSSKPDLPSPGIEKPVIEPDAQAMNKSALPGYLSDDIWRRFKDHSLDKPMCGGPTYIQVTTEERAGNNFINPRTGEPYPIVTDIRGNSYIVKETLC